MGFCIDPSFFPSLQIPAPKKGGITTHLAVFQWDNPGVVGGTDLIVISESPAVRLLPKPFDTILF